MSRKTYIHEISQMVTISKKRQYEIQIGSIISRILPNFLTAGDCQVLETVYNQDNPGCGGAGPHIHTNSKEVFYQITGSTIFGDGTILKPGEFKIIESGEEHSCELTQDGKCIVIIHPPTEDLPKGDAQCQQSKLNL